MVCEMGNENKEKKEVDSAKKKKKIVKICIFSIIGVALIAVIASGVISSRKPMSVMVTTCKLDDLDQVIDLSGTVSSVETKTYFSDISATIGEIKVRPGDTVKKGDVLFEYDLTDLDNQIALQEYKLEASEGSYDASIERNGKTLYRLSEASTNLEVLDTQIEDWTNYVNELEKKISDKKAALAYEGAMLQISLIDWRDRPDSDEYINLQKLVQINNYEQQNNAQIAEWQTELTKARNELNEFISYRSQMRSQENSSKDSASTQGEKAQNEANYESNKLEGENALEAYEEAKGGITAEFNGVIESVDQVNGAPVSKGMKILSMQSIDNVVVKVMLTKYDLENVSIGMNAEIAVNGSKYTGHVSKINSIATKNSTGATVVETEISIDNPDDNIIIGIDAKVSILANSKKGVPIVPYDVINYDSDGAFVFVVKDGKAIKQHIELGISDDFCAEVISGVYENDHIISANTDFIVDGMDVTEIVSE